MKLYVRTDRSDSHCYWSIAQRSFLGVFDLFQFRWNTSYDTSYNGKLCKKDVYVLSFWHDNFQIVFRPTPKEIK